MGLDRPFAPANGLHYMHALYVRYSTKSSSVLSK